MPLRARLAAACLALGLVPALLVAPSASAAPPAPVLTSTTVDPGDPCTGAGRSAEVTWSPGSGGDAVSRYDVLLARPAGATPEVRGSVEPGATLEWRFTGLPSVNEQVGVTVRAIGADGASADATATLAGPRDERRPDAPRSFTVGSAGDTDVTLSWSLPDDDLGVCGYTLLRDGVAVAELGRDATSFTDRGLERGRTYGYAVVARDSIGAGAGATLAHTTPSPRAVVPVGPAPTCAYRDTPTSTPGVADRILLASVCLVNFERSRRGVPPVYVDARLALAAQRHSDDMVARGYYDHVSPEGCGLSCRVVPTGYPMSSLAENIFLSPTSASKAVAGWIASPGHLTNLSNASYWTMGAGGAFVAEPMWTHVFGDEPPAPDAVHGLEPQFQGPADPTGTAGRSPGSATGTGASPLPGTTSAPRRTASASISSVRARLRGRRLTVSGRARPARASIRLTMRRGGRSRTVRGRVRSSGTFRMVATAPRGRGRLRVTVRVGRASRSLTLR
jgi:uncharacterized protein YkwD